MFANASIINLLTYIVDQILLEQWTNLNEREAENAKLINKNIDSPY